MEQMNMGTVPNSLNKNNSRGRAALKWTVGVLIVILSLLLISYPFVSNYLVSKNQDSEIAAYEEEVESVSAEELASQREKAELYNKNLLGNFEMIDPYTYELQTNDDDEYYELLSTGNSGIMGYVEIPVINVNLPIYHGTSDEVLKKGAGHMIGTSLPIGGTGTHAVITGHTGLPTAKLFTDLDQLAIGDVFYITTLGEKMAYKVDNITTIDPQDTELLRIDPDEDYVSLVTCTPFGVNTERLVVRGTRVSLEEAQALLDDNTRQAQSTWLYQYKLALMTAVVVFAVILTVYFIFRYRHKRKEGTAT